MIIWTYADPEKAPIAIDTRHTANIFGVKFLPETGDREIVTGAMDREVRLHTLEALPNVRLPHGESRSGSMLRRDRDNPQLMLVSPETRIFSCHTARVKVCSAVIALVLSFYDHTLFALL